jgi:hypothetical protein
MFRLTDANEELIMTFLLWPVQIAVSQVILRFDETRLTPEQLAKAWLPASRDLATVLFSPFCIPFHTLRTRVRMNSKESLLGVFWGIVYTLVWACVLLAVDAIFSQMLHLLFCEGKQC